MKIVELCCSTTCPRVEIYEDYVRIGEKPNFITLSKDEWNTLIEKVKSGELGEL